MREPQIGDRVKVTASEEELKEIWAPWVAGETGTLVGIDPSSDLPYLVRTDSENDTWFLRRSDFVVLAEPYAKPTTRPKTETLRIMQALAEAGEAASVRLELDGGEFVLSDDEKAMLLNAYRALYEKLKGDL